VVGWGFCMMLILHTTKWPVGWMSGSAHLPNHTNIYSYIIQALGSTHLPYSVQQQLFSVPPEYRHTSLAPFSPHPPPTLTLPPSLPPSYTGRRRPAPLPPRRARLQPAIPKTVGPPDRPGRPGQVLLHLRGVGPGASHSDGAPRLDDLREWVAVLFDCVHEQ
jgi:hypothetical protein